MPSAPATPDEIGRNVATGLNKLGLAIRHQAWHGATPGALTPTQGQILALLHARAAQPVRLSEIARELGVTPPTASDAVARLVARGYLRKRAAADDARALAIRLTARGRREALRTLGWTDLLVHSVATLDAYEQGVMLRMLTKMIRELQEQSAIPASRMCIDCRYFRPFAHPHREHPHHCAFVDAAFGDRELRLACADHERAPVDARRRIWNAFIACHPEHPGRSGGRDISATTT